MLGRLLCSVVGRGESVLDSVGGGNTGQRVSWGRDNIRTPRVEVTNLAAPVTPSSDEDVLIGIVTG